MPIRSISQTNLSVGFISRARSCFWCEVSSHVGPHAHLSSVGLRPKLCLQLAGFSICTLLEERPSQERLENRLTRRWRTQAPMMMKVRRHASPPGSRSPSRCVDVSACTGSCTAERRSAPVFTLLQASVPAHVSPLMDVCVPVTMRQRAASFVLDGPQWKVAPPPAAVKRHTSSPPPNPVKKICLLE